MQKVLILGATGQVGQELLKVLPDAIAPERSQLDFYQPATLEKLVTDSQATVVINAAAYTAVDKAESEPDLAALANAITPQYIAKACQKLGAYLIHLSTDYVFDGTANTPYLETAPTNPLSVYGQTKLAGEQAIQAHCTNYLILRTAWVYGSLGKTNFVKTMLRVGKECREIRVVYDQIGSPTWAADIARAIAQLIPQLEPSLAGIYHYTNSGVCSWYDFAIAIFQTARDLGWPLAVQQVQPIRTHEYPTPATRPAYSVLSGAKLRPLLSDYPPHWQASLTKMLLELQ